MSAEQVKDVCSKLLKMFEEGSFPPAAARTVIARIAGDDRPSTSWSFTNQMLMFLSETDDCRGYRQWQQVNRWVRKGAKAIYILVPLTRKTKMVTNNDGEEKEETRVTISGFKLAPVFRYEDTDGEELTSYNYSPPELPPLNNVAQKYGMVSYYPYHQRELGSCSLKGNIAIYSHDVDVFFHELGHQIHNTIKPLKGGQDSIQELVAEMVSVVLCEMYCIQGYQWQGWEYMKAYAGEDPVKTLRAIGSILNDVEAVVMKIMAVDHELRILGTAI